MKIIKILKFDGIKRQNPPLYILTLFVSIPIGLLVSSAIGIYILIFINSIKKGFIIDGIIPSQKALQFKYYHPSGIYCRCFLDGKNTEFGNKIVFYTVKPHLLQSIEQQVLKKFAQNPEHFSNN